MPRPLAALSLALSLAVVACESKDPVVLELDGETVRRSDFERHVAALEARGARADCAPEARRGLLESFLEQRALVIEARRRGLLGAGASAEQEADGGGAPARVRRALAARLRAGDRGLARESRRGARRSGTRHPAPDPGGLVRTRRAT